MNLDERAALVGITRKQGESDEQLLVRVEAAEREKKTETREVPLLDVRAAVLPDSVDTEARTVTFVASTGYKDLRRGLFTDDFYEELEISDRAIRMERYENGAPLLDNHQRFGSVTDVVVGVIERAWIEAGKILTKVRFAEGEKEESIFRKVAGGIIRHVSIDYRVHRWEKTRQQGDELDTHCAVDWEPMGLSLVPIAFDPGAMSRGNERGDKYPVEIVDLIDRAVVPAGKTGDNAMNLDERAALVGITRNDGETDEALMLRVVAAEAKAKEEKERKASGLQSLSAEEAEQIARDAVTAERKRSQGIIDAVRVAGLDDEFATRHVNEGTGLDDTRAAIFDELAKNQPDAQRGSQRIEFGMEHAQEQRSAIVTAIRHRANPAIELDDASRSFAGMTLERMAEECLRMAGQQVPNSRREMIERAMTSSDLPNILADVANKELRAGYAEQPRRFVGVFRRRTATDFKNINIMQLSSAPDLVQKNENGEYKTGTLIDGKETYKLTTVGRIINITRETIINDDLDALTRLPFMFAASAARYESQTVWDLLNNNPTMGDGTALFHADHNNTLAAGAINATNVGAGRRLMRKQTGLQSEVLDIEPRHILTGPDKELELDQFFGTFMPTEQGNITPANLRSLVPAVAAQLTGNNWYLAADYNQVDTIEYAYLEGEEGVYTETKEGFEVDGIQVKARLDFAAKTVDWRGLFRNGS